MNLEAALKAERQRRAERESVAMSTTVLSGLIDVKAGEFRGSVNFPQPFNGTPIVAFGYQAGPTTPLPAGHYPEHSIMVLKYHVKKRPDQVTDIITGFDFAGVLHGGQVGGTAKMRGQFGWIAVGQAFVGNI